MRHERVEGERPQDSITPLPRWGAFYVLDGKLHERCGIFGVFHNKDASRLTYLGLYALQHRGQESSGIVSADGDVLKIHKAMGLVNQVFRRDEPLARLDGMHAIGHNRYSTTGASSLANAQPILINCKIGQIAGAHNGNLTNARSLRAEMENDGSIFTSSTDTEVIMHLIARSKHDTVASMILDALSRVRGAYSILFLTKDALYGARDPRGVRPLLLGKKENSFFLSSESCAFDLVGADMVREIKPGEMIRIDRRGARSYTVPAFEPVEGHAHCVFEFIYFSRPDSFVFGENVDKVRRKLGRQLAREHPAPGADIVMGVPDSATTAALGYAEESGIKYDIGLIRNHYVGRTFIQPAQAGRNFGVRVKFNTVKGVLKGKRVVVVDDSIVRGTTMKSIIALLRTAEPEEIHLRVSSPPILCPCFYGIDMPTKQELIGSSKSVNEIRRYMGADSLGYLSIDGMLSVMPSPHENFCNACFSGAYPIGINGTGEDA
ncbi:MAG: amidophosphoribosyltransferase [Chitinivibrionales bacterium]|nr:amidophosphoribosyltransferase [Chitinivibrionales bacterium]MBD3394287.1 amidophosphoribosyltransferase [Chitinivibrionales bacterium]